MAANALVMPEFKRERRYLVMKLKDLDACLTAEEMRILSIIATKCGGYRRAAGKPDLECVVVESDWPEFEPTLAAIEARMTGQPSIIETLSKVADIIEREAAISFESNMDMKGNWSQECLDQDAKEEYDEMMKVLSQVRALMVVEA